MRKMLLVAAAATFYSTASMAANAYGPTTFGRLLQYCQNSFDSMSGRRHDVEQSSICIGILFGYMNFYVHYVAHGLKPAHCMIDHNATVEDLIAMIVSNKNVPDSVKNDQYTEVFEGLLSKRYPLPCRK